MTGGQEEAGNLEMSSRQPGPNAYNLGIRIFADAETKGNPDVFPFACRAIGKRNKHRTLERRNRPGGRLRISSVRGGRGSERQAEGEELWFKGQGGPGVRCTPDAEYRDAGRYLWWKHRAGTV
jgi:hypothetical protein